MVGRLVFDLITIVHLGVKFTKAAIFAYRVRSLGLLHTMYATFFTFSAFSVFRQIVHTSVVDFFATKVNNEK